MKNISKIKLRLIQFIESKGFTKNKFYTKSGVANGTLDKSSKLSIDSIEKTIYIFPDIDLHWLITGKKKIEDCQESQTLKVEEETEDYINYKDKYLKLLEQNIKLRDKVDELKEKKECNTIVTNTINK